MFTVLLVSSLISVCPKLSRIVARFNLLSERLSASRTPKNNRERAALRKTRSERLACFLRILQRAALVTKELSSERETLRRESEKLSGWLKFSPVESGVSHRLTGGMFGQTTKESPVEIVNRLKLAQISEETVSHLQSMRERLSVLNEKVEILSRLESAIRSLRIEILNSEKAENLAQSESLSLILASMPSTTWKNCKNDRNHVCGMQGNSAESLIEFVRTPRDRTGKRNSVCSHSGRGVSTARGERLFYWNDYKKTESQWLVYSDDLAFRVHSRWSENRSVSEKKDMISLAFLRQARNGKGPLAETYEFLSRILSPAFFAEFEFERSDRWSRISANLVRVKLQRVHSLLLNPPQWVREFVSGFTSQSVIELSERSKALQRLKDRLSISESGVARQIVLSRTQRVCSFSLVFNPENFSDEIEKARKGTLPIGDNLIQLLPIECENLEIGESEILPLSISRSLVLNSSGYSFEYFVTNDFGARIPARLRDSIRFALSLHDGRIPELTTEESSPEIQTQIRAELFKRISENLRSRRMPFLQELHRKAGNRESLGESLSHLSLERKERAERLRILRETEVVSISDSVQTGNCRAGSLEFAARLGIHSETISGRELATRWKKYGYPENALFVRVIESLAQKLQRAERAALSE